jgi:tryptophan synthase alpha chain
MGVTGARSALSNDAKHLVSRIRKASNLPVAVGLGVSNRDQASEISQFADGVIVGSAFLKLLLEGKGPDAVEELASNLASGVRKSPN